jgi:hypothetical protein
LGAGTYTATISVSGENGIGASFGVSFTVNPTGTPNPPYTPNYRIGLSETGTYTFPGTSVGYGAQTARTVTVNNTGNLATGALTIGKSGANAASFTVSKTDIGDIAVSGNDTFTVVPMTGLGVGTYTTTITVSGGNGASASFNVNFTVTVPAVPVYSIGLSETGPYTFPGAATGYGAQTARTVTVNNTGNQATGALTIGKSGADAGSFTVSRTNLDSIGVNRSGSFTVAPAPGLGVGAYAAVVTVSAGYGISASFNVSFTVTQGLSANANLAALSVSPGWLDQTFSPSNTAYTVTVPYTTTSIEVNAVPADFGKATCEQFPTPNPVSLSAGANTIRVRVTAEDGTTTRDYRITVTRTPLSANANLASLVVDVGALAPAFSPNTMAYTVLVPNATGSITVTAAVADTGKATLLQSPANPVTLGAGSTVITLTVTAEDGTATRNYTVTVNKSTAANAVNVVIGIADERIDLTRSTENDLSREAGNTLRLTAPAGYTNYAWRVDSEPNGYNGISDRVIELNPSWYNYSYGTHSVLLEFEKDSVLYGCEVLFRAVR